MTWVALTIAAAFVQNLRFMLQKRLTETGLSTAGATVARYLWSAPVVALALVAVLSAKGAALPDLSLRFWGFSVLGAATQICATLCVVRLFALRNFAVGTTFKRSETILAALVGVAILGETLPVAGWVVLVVGLVGVLLMSKNPMAVTRGVLNQSTALGLGSGMLFGICAVSYRAASLSLSVNDTAIAALTALCAAVWLQLVMMLGYFMIRETAEVPRVIRAWRQTIYVSLTSVIGSALLFSAFTLQTVAYVNAVIQIELIFAAAASHLFFKERITPREMLGMVILTGSIVVLLVVS